MNDKKKCSNCFYPRAHISGEAFCELSGNEIHENYCCDNWVDEDKVCCNTCFYAKPDYVFCDLAGCYANKGRCCGNWTPKKGTTVITPAVIDSIREAVECLEDDIENLEKGVAHKKDIYTKALEVLTAKQKKLDEMNAFLFECDKMEAE